MTTPSAINIKMKFPEFESVSDAAIELAVEEAIISVGSHWPDKYQTLALMYFTAHLLAVAAASADSGGREVTSETIGQISVTYKSATDVGKISVGDLSTTSYGAKFAEFRNLAFPAIMVV
jgi:hypothetical protein